MKSDLVKNLILCAMLLMQGGQVLAQDQRPDAAGVEDESESPVASGRIVSPLVLEIRIDPAIQLSTKDAKSSKAQRQKVCHLLGSALKVGGGAWGSGGFATTKCVDARKGKKKGKQLSWLLTMTSVQSNIEIVVSYASEPTHVPVELARVVLAESEDLLKFFDDEEYVDMVAFAIMDQLPFLAAIKFPQDSDDLNFKVRYPRIGASRDRKFALVNPPKSLVLYTLEIDPQTGIFKSQVLGQAKLESMEPTNEEYRRKNRGKRDALQGYAVYSFDEKTAASVRSNQVWMHNSEGRGRKTSEIGRVVSAATSKLVESKKNGSLGSMLEGGLDLFTNALLDTAASGYIGVRFGKQLLAGDPLLAKTKFFGLLSEIRGGPLGGLRIYYDLLPETKSEVDGFNTSIGWSRLIFGTSIGFAPSILVDRLDITPKIGMWTLSATLPTERNEAGAVAATADFKFKRQFSFGIEVGMEWASIAYLVRSWYGFDMALSLGRLGGSSVQSNRFGVDTFFNVGPRFSVFGAKLKTAILLFGMYESVELGSTKAKKDGVDAGEISSISYDGGYGGLGLGISW